MTYNVREVQKTKDMLARNSLSELKKSFVAFEKKKRREQQAIYETGLKLAEREMAERKMIERAVRWADYGLSLPRTDRTAHQGSVRGWILP